jgi:hypothetical protein
MNASRLLASALLAAAALLAGCAATVTTQGGARQASLAVPSASARLLVVHFTGSDEVLKSKDWEALKGEWRGALKTAAEAKGMTVRFAETAPSAAAEDGTVAAVRVADYRYVTPGARYGFGVFTGNAFMDARVDFQDLRSGRAFGQRQYNTSSSAWQGIFSAVTDKQLAAISAQMVDEITRR